MKQGRLCVPVFLLLLFSASCAAPPSPEDLKKIEALQSELINLRSEITAAEKKNASLSGGLVKALVEARLEVLRTTESLVKERIHALESGAKITVEVPGTEPDQELAKELEQEIKSQLIELNAAREEAAKYGGGLVAAMKDATVATQEQTIAMLRQRYLAAKYGLPTIFRATTAGRAPLQETPEATATGTTTAEVDVPKEVAQEVVSVKLLRKLFTEQDYQEFIFFDIEVTAKGLDKPARAIKGALHLQDLFGEARMSINWTIDVPLKPGQTVTKKGTGFKYNQFVGQHQWVRSTKIENMTASFTVKSILYKDGSRRDL